jgi:hypothetical protein
LDSRHSLRKSPFAELIVVRLPDSALEALLLLTVRGLKNVVTELQERVYKTIPQLRFGVSPAELRDLLECKRTVEDCLMSGRAMQSALATVLGEGESLSND